MSASARLGGVEAARGVAAVLVVLAHAGTLLSGPRDFGVLPLGGALHFGYAGVDFFFVLSGFIICHVHAADIGLPQRLRRYAWRRFVRIYPLYWTVLLLYMLLLVVSPTREGTERDPLLIVTSALLLPNPSYEPILGVAWTLQHEVLFYALFATLILNRRLGRVVLGGWLALIAVNAVTGRLETYPFGFLTSLYNAEFFVGMLVATLLRKHRAAWPLERRAAWPLERRVAWPLGRRVAWPLERRAAWPLACLAAGAVLFVATGLIDDWGPAIPVHSPPLRAAYAAGAGLALYGLAGAEMHARLAAIPRWMVAVGSASYSIYLIHVVVLMIIQQALRPAAHVLPLDLAFVMAVAATVAAAVLFSRTIEQPLLRHFQELNRKRRAVTTSP